MQDYFFRRVKVIGEEKNKHGLEYKKLNEPRLELKNVKLSITKSPTGPVVFVYPLLGCSGSQEILDCLELIQHKLETSFRPLEEKEYSSTGSLIRRGNSGKGIPYLKVSCDSSLLGKGDCVTYCGNIGFILDRFYLIPSKKMISLKLDSISEHLSCTKLVRTVKSFATDNPLTSPRVAGPCQSDGDTPVVSVESVRIDIK